MTLHHTVRVDHLAYVLATRRALRISCLDDWRAQTGRGVKRAGKAG